MAGRAGSCGGCGGCQGEGEDAGAFFFTFPTALLFSQEEQAAAAAAAGVKVKEKTLVELRSEQGVARGQNQNLEKDYLRLTSLPRSVGSGWVVGWLGGWGVLGAAPLHSVGCGLALL